MLNVASAKLIATVLASSISSISGFLSFKSVTNSCEPDKQIQTNTKKKSACPMTQGKPFVTNYIDQLMDQLDDEDWDEIKLF